MRHGCVCGSALVAALALSASTAQATSLFKQLSESPVATPQELQVRANPYADAVFSPVDKFSRGLINLMTGVLEIPRTIGEQQYAHGWQRGWTRGLVDGVKRAGIRTGGGAWDAVTFPAPPYHKLFLRPAVIVGALGLYRGLPEDIRWERLEPPGSWLSGGPVAAPNAALTAPLRHVVEDDTR